MVVIGILKVHKACSILVQGQFKIAIEVSTAAISYLRQFQKHHNDEAHKRKKEVSLLIRRALCWIQLAQIQLGQYIDSLVTLELAVSKTPFPGAAFDCDLTASDQLNRLHDIVKKSIQMLNSPIIISHVINFEGFSHHLLIYFVIPMAKERFSMRLVFIKHNFAHSAYII